MAFIDKVKARIPQRVLVEISRSDHQNPGQLPDDTIIQNAIDDASAEFQIRAGFAPVEADPSHVGAIVQGTLAYLFSFYAQETEAQNNLRFRFLSMCDGIRGIHTATATTSSELTPSPEVESVTRPVRPDHDRSNYAKYLGGFRGGRRRLFGDE